MIKIPDEYVLFKHDDDWSAKLCETLTNCLAGSGSSRYCC